MIKRSIGKKTVVISSALILALAMLAIWLLNSFQVELTSGKSAALQAEPSFTQELDGLSKQAARSASPDKQAQIEAAVAAYREKLDYLFAQTLPNGDPSKHKSMSYDEDWCIAYNDLRQEDLAIYQQERDEWLLSRGYATIWDPNAPALQQDDPRFYPERNQHLIPYEEMPHDELTEQAFNNDFHALIVLSQRPETHWKERDKIDSRLVFLGDTTLGLSSFVSKPIYLAISKIKNGETAEVYEMVYKALVFAEYGLIRGDDYAMGMLIQAVEGLEDTPESNKLKEIISSIPSDKIKQTALQFMENLNASRAEHNFPPFEAETPSKAARAYQFLMHSDILLRFENATDADWFPARWKDEYLAMTPCRERHIKLHKFNYEQYPAIYAELKQELAQFQVQP